MKKRWIILLVIAFLFAIASICFSYSLKQENTEEIKYEEFLEMVEENKVDEIIWTAENENITVIVGKKEYSTENPKYDNFKKDMLEKGIEVQEKYGIDEYSTILMIIVQVILYGIFFTIMIKSTGMGLGLFKKKAQDTTSDVKFSDVAGLEEVKEDLMTVVDFLRNPEQYKEAGAEIPKGVLLYGPPGTGKTLLAKAVAGEAGVRFKAVSGSDFEEKFVGVGASKMRNLFMDAKKNAPCIIFIDEIDSMGGRRHSKQSNYDRQTLNSLLSEMDGFDGSKGVIVIAATNRLEDLDPALTRPGRFDNHFAVSLPVTAKERKVIIDLYAKNKKLSSDVDLDVFSKETMGSSPASIKTVLNEAAIIAARRNNGIITKAILDEAWMKHIMEGHLKKHSDKTDVGMIAWHEAGHALAGILLGKDIAKASIIPSTSGTGGATFITPKKMGLFTKSELEEEIMVLYAGRCAEKLYSGKFTTGASNDIKKATELIRQMIEEYGMDDRVGMLNLEVLSEDRLLKYAKDISYDLETRAYNLLSSNLDSLKKIADELTEKETLTGEEMKKIVELC